MKKTILLSFLILMMTTMVAENVGQNRAMQVARNFAAQHDRSASQIQTDVVYSHPMPNKRDAAFYVVNLVETGFVIVAADDVAHPVLGYSFERPWPTEGNLPPQVTDYLDDLANQIESASETTPDRDIANEWQELLAINPNNPPQPRGTRTEVGPLLTTNWDQEPYYNALCPEDPYGPDGHVPTGCVATAMAQIINYWGFPEHGYGTHSFIITDDVAQYLGITRYGDYDTLAVDYYGATYDYDNMPNELTASNSQTEIDAVAQLMFHCGVAVNMQYGAYSSGAFDEDVRSALISNFGFSPSMGYSQKYMYSSKAWTDSLKANIDRGEPVFYCGRGIIGGHAFVCDGYDQDDYFHFNFGWGGSCDGMYLTTATSAGHGFNDWQAAIMGIRPDSNPHTVICQRVYYFQNTENFTVEKPIDLYNLRGLSNYPAANELIGARIELNFVPENGLGQLVLDVLGFDEDQSVVIYDGINKDSLVRVIETRGWGDYDGLPSDTIFRNMACTDFSPIVSTRHGFTVVAYGYGGQPEGFHLLISDANDCRVVSDLNASQEDNGVLVSWTENGDATQWQVMVGDNLYNCNETHLLLTELSPNDTYEVKVRAICDEQHVSSWNSIVVNKKIYWTDIVKTQPDGFVQDGDTIRITTAEGLAWLSIRCKDLDFLSASNLYFLSIENDIDLEGYLWEPIFNWYGDIEGHGHVISNMNIRNLNHGYSGLFSSLGGVKINGVGTRNCMVNATSSSGSIAGSLTYSQVSNCFSENHQIISDVFAGGLFGDVLYSEINNCYAYGNIYAPKGHGGLAGYTNNTSIYNSVSQLGESFNWCDIFGGNLKGLITQSVNGGTFSNCFSEISNAKWFNTDPDTYRYYFLGNLNYADAIDNLATFNISIDPMGMLFADTAVNYSLGDNMEVVTALNNWVTDKNLPDFRIWIRDDITHMPVFGDYYEVTCPNVSNFTASNIPYNNGFAVSLSWQENGDAVEWQVKYNIVDAPEEDAVVFTTNNTQNIIEGLSMGHEYHFYVRPVCGESYIGWGQPIKLYVDKALWTDIVTECPEGYLEDAEGNITISSAEGLAWLLAKAEQNNDFPDITVSIVNDLDMGAYRWIPIWCFRGTMEGNNHTISNLTCRGFESVGFVGYTQNATIRNLTITNSEFSGNERVGSFVGWDYYSTFKNCHAKNITVNGYRYAGGFVGRTDGGEFKNCSASGLVVGDVDVGGFLGGTQSGTQVSNCYSNCNIHYLRQASPDIRGGLIGSMCSSLTNSYSAGLIEFDCTIDEYKGSAAGFMYYDPYNEVEMHYVYAQELEGIPFIGRAFNIPEDHISDTSSFANNGVLSHSVTIDNSSYIDLLSALNAWVDANNTDGQYLHWVADTANVNGGFPMLEQKPSANHWPEPQGYEGNMTFAGTVIVDGEEVASDFIELGAFVGDECRGSALPVKMGERRVYFLLVAGNAEDEGTALDFKLYDHLLHRELDYYCTNNQSYHEDLALGVDELYRFNFLTEVEQTVQMSDGWTWWSTGVELSYIDGLSMLEDALGDTGVIIKTSNQFVQNMDWGEGWMGSLTTLTNERGYKIQTTAECAVTMRGPVARPSDHPITIQPEWNWIGYPVAHAQNVTSALEGFQPSANDIIKGQTGYATYIQGLGWLPEFTLEPGKGYLYHSNNSANQTLMYSANRGDMPKEEADTRFWHGNVHAYADNLCLLAVVSIDGEEMRTESLELGAFVGDECRGSARLMYVEPFDRYFAVMTVSGEDGDEVYFKLMDMSDQSVRRSSSSSVVFSNNAVVGTIDIPFVAAFLGTASEEEQGGSLAVYPNPVDHGEPFRLLVPEEETVVEWTVFDALGAAVRHKTGAFDSHTVEGLPVSGVYLVKAVCKSGNTYHHRLIVK